MPVGICLASSLDGPVVPGTAGPGTNPAAVITRDEEVVGLKRLEVNHVAMLLLWCMCVDYYEEDTIGVTIYGEHHRFLLVDRSKQHLFRETTESEAQCEDLTVPHAVELLLGRKLVVTRIDFRIGALSFQIGAEFARH